MKKLLLIFLLFFAAKSFAQYPAIQNLGNDSTLIRIGATYNGGIKGGLINMTVADTTAANLLRIKAYPGAMIFTTNDGLAWVRNMTATGWVLLGGGSSPSGSFWRVGGNEFPITLPTRDIGTGSFYGGAVGLMTNGIVRAIIPNGGFTLSNDTTSNKIFTINPSTKELGYANWNNGGGGGSSNLTGRERYALRFPGYSGSNVYTGQFYPVGVPFYNCFYEWWVRVDSSGYVWSDGYGGSHDMLFGFTAGDTTVQISGNMFDEYTGQSFGSWDNMKRGTVHHVSVAFTGTYIITWIDGVPTQRLARTAKRQNVPSSGCGGGYLGGSDHQNAELILFSMRAYEFGLPRYIGDGDCFFPETNFTAANNDVVFCVNEFNPNANMVNDKSSGFYGMKHDGFRNYSVGGDPIYPQRASGVDSLPQYVVDSIVIDSYTGGISSAPVGAKIYDFFERQDQVPAFTGSPTIDSTQGGSLGKKKYIYSMYGGPIYAGIINKYCYFSGSSLQNYAKVLGDGPSQDVRATFSNGTSEVAVDILSNVTDNNNKILARVSNGGQNLNLYKWVGGVFTSLGGYSGTAITEVKLVVSGGTATVYGDGVSRITGSVLDVPSSNYSGFGCNSAYSRVKKFEVY